MGLPHVKWLNRYRSLSAVGPRKASTTTYKNRPHQPNRVRVVERLNGLDRS